MAPPTVWLVRHAAAAGTDGRCCGSLDVPLSEHGVRQAHEAARTLQPEPISHAYSSNLSRALETARILAAPHGIAVQAMAGFAEMHFGDLEGLSYAEIEARYPDVFRSWMSNPTETEFPNGESFVRMRTRVLRAMDLLVSRHENATILVVSHAGPIRALLSAALGMPDHLIFRLEQKHTAINRIRYEDSGAIVQLMNG
jgi:alpha-ribazole phosphatase